MSSLRIVGSRPLAVDDTACPTEQETQHHHPLHRHTRHTPRTAPRLRTKRRRGADTQDGIDESGASEELQMMLNEHLQRTSDLVIRVADRRPGDRGASDGDDQDGSEEGRRSGATGHGTIAASTHAGTQGGQRSARLEAEYALLEVRGCISGKIRENGSTYEILAALFEFLSSPNADAASQATLLRVRERLVLAVGAPTQPALPHQQSSNLLLPLLMLSLYRTRTDNERARGRAMLRSLIGRRRNRI